jgi:CheY-like chemotaxis protein
MNGVQLLGAIQQRSETPIKAVVLTGNTAPDQIEMIQSSGWKVLYKPADLPTLLSAIEEQDPQH